ncbi:MAG: ATPase domain protein, partial [Capsulimonas sp.]|nr:ATPase domain protein [Capsulimonas sp.]
LMLDRVSKQVSQKGMDFEVTEKAKEVLAKEGYDPQYGARPLRRAVQRLVEDPLSEEVLLGKFQANDTILVDADDDNKIVFRKGAPMGLDSDPTPETTTTETSEAPIASTIE